MSTYLLTLPRLRVQNANAISGPLTWGFPAMTAFIGLMHALERKCQQAGIKVHFDGIGVVCHDAVPQTHRNTYDNHSFLLTRNPLKADGSTAAIVEEGRIHLELTLVLRVRGEACEDTDEARADIAERIDALLHTLRIAGGSVLERNAALPAIHRRPVLDVLVSENTPRLYRRQMRELKRRLLPGFALILRDDVLEAHRQRMPADTSALDAWLDITRLNYRFDPEAPPEACWPRIRRHSGWLVPIPVGYSALSDEIPPDDILNARDGETPLRFVEPLFSIGEWRSPHRMQRVDELLWRIKPDTDERLFLLDMCANVVLDDEDGDDDAPEYDDDAF